MTEAEPSAERTDEPPSDDQGASPHRTQSLSEIALAGFTGWLGREVFGGLLVRLFSRDAEGTLTEYRRRSVVNGEPDRFETDSYVATFLDDAGRTRSACATAGSPADRHRPRRHRLRGADRLPGDPRGPRHPDRPDHPDHPPGLRLSRPSE
ncbi:hypothetical protein [Frankia sp. AgKG'84/4]|uniref:hypothetical protein n=1 Tax=Frankia sp. AgKG'84/4 TaxID=573490 RepID=UPI002010342E|nr:hypothetical protein [Frankia sp. AgKG'84/4]MCL9794561.1 hypothetical protein [Frankia sp. AgKG'84/4]